MGCDFSFVHAADLHLGSRFKEVTVTDPENGRRMQESVSRSFERIVDGTRDRTDFMVVSGDLYDEAYMSPRTRYRFAQAAERYGKPVFVVKGNHDFGETWEDSVPYPPNVHVFPSEPKTFSMTIRGRRVDVTGVSYAEWHTTENLAVKLKGSSEAFTIGVVHCSVREVADSDEYAPCRTDDLIGRGVDYWALGHIHRRTVVREANPAVVYPGNIQGRNPRETGEKGCYIVDVKGDEVSTEFLPTQEILWLDAVADISGLNDLNSLLKPLRFPKGSIVSLTIRGRGPLNRVVRSDPQGIAEQLSAGNGCTVNLRAVETVPEIDVDVLRNGETLMSEVVKTAGEFEAMSDAEITDMLCTGPATDVREMVEYLASKGELKEILAEAELSLLSRMSEGSQ